MSQERPYKSIPDRKEAIQFVVNEAKEGDVILIAGKGMKRIRLSGKKFSILMIGLLQKRRLRRE